MTLSVTERAFRETRKTQIEPQLVLSIAGVPTLLGAVEILRLIRVGDPGLLIGNAWRIGGLTAVEDQAAVLSFEKGGGTTIDQQLQPDKGSVSSVTSVQVALIDKNLVGSEIISPGVVVADVLGAKATLSMGFRNTAFPQDYVPIMSGIVEEVESGSGVIKISIAHPEQLKRQKIYSPEDALLASPITDVAATIPLVSASHLPSPQPGPDGSFDTAIRFYVKIEDEIIRYTGISGNNLTGCVRGQLATVNVAHAVPAEGQPVRTLLQLSDPAVYCALKIMLSGKNGPWVEGLEIDAFNHPDPFTTIPNSLYFEGVDLVRDHGVSVGDFITTTGASNGANNVSNEPITQLEITASGSYVVIGGGVAFVDEPGTAAVVAFRSQFDTLGYGLALDPDQVDVAEHLYWHNFQLAPFTYRFVIDDTVDGKEFLDSEVYKPIGAYSIPRSGRCSMGYHVGPVVRGALPVLSRTNVKDPHEIRLKRSINRNFYNAVVYKFDQVLATGKFASGDIEFSAESRNRIKVGSRPLVIESSGLRRDLDGNGIAERIASRYLLRYRFAPEYFEQVGVLFRDGYPIEPGDPVLFDPDGLKITNLADGTRSKPPKVYTVVNKKLDLKTGDCKVSLTDANFDESERYGAVSPSSLVTGGTTTEILIQDSFGSYFPGNESKKWEEYLGLPIRVHSEDFTFDEEVILLGIDTGNRYKLLIDPSTPLSGAPLAGYIIDVGDYPAGTDPAENATYKAVHAFQGPTVAIVSAPNDTQFVVGAGDVARFTVGDTVRVHNADFSDDSGELEITDVTGTTITVLSSMGFTPTSDHAAEGMGFPDGGRTYRFF